MENDDEEILPDEEADDVGESDEEILALAKKRFAASEEAEADIRKEALEDLKFRAGDQWPEDIKNLRDRQKRPCLVINRLPQQIRQITNDQRQNPTEIKVNPVDAKATVETAKIFQGIIRHIEYSSNAEQAYDTAFEGAVGNSFGYYRFLTQYCNDTSFDQDIVIKRIRDPFSVRLDFMAQEPDGSDANWGFIEDVMTHDDFEQQYGQSKLAQMEDWKSLSSKSAGWVATDTVRIAEYFYKTFKKETLVKLSDGFIGLKKDLPPNLPEGVTIEQERVVQVPTIKWCKINGFEILEKTEWLGKWIPIVPVYGNEIIIEGKRYLESVIRHARDPQRMYNFWVSSQAETISLAPKSPFIMAEGQIEGHEAEWENANTEVRSVLQYKATTIAGQPAPPPTRNTYEPPIQALNAASQMAAEDIKATTGIYDASLGNRSNEISGVSIQRRATQSEKSNFHFVDNLARSIRHGGRILIDLIPKIYDTERAERILKEDDTADIVELNKIFMKNGESVKYDLSLGEYDIAISQGPSFATKRQEAVSSMLDLVKSAPQTMQMVMDLLVKNMDWPGAQEISERLKKLLPPGIAETDADKQAPIPPQIKQQMQQMNTMIQNLSQQLSVASNEIKTKRFELESKERIEMAKLQTAATIELAMHMQADGQVMLEHNIAQIHKRLDLLNEDIPVGQEPIPPAGVQPPAPGQVPNPMGQQQPQPSGGQPLMQGR